MFFFHRRDAVAHEVGGHLDTDIRLTLSHSIPFTVTYYAAARENAGRLADQWIVVLHHRPPLNAEWRGATPVHRPKSHPLAGDRERVDDVSLVLPAVEERAEGDRPVTVEPGAHELRRTGGAQALLVGLDVDVLVVVNARRNEDPL